jgi:hypothetical protein
MKSAILVLTLTAFGACRKQASKEQTANSNSNTGSEGPFGGKALTGDKFYFRGTKSLK